MIARRVLLAFVVAAVGCAGSSEPAVTPVVRPTAAQSSALDPLAHFQCPVGPSPLVNQSRTLATDETWTADHVYMVTGIIETGAHSLRIEAGTVVCFDLGGIVVGAGGAFAVNGTPEQHVTFTHQLSGHSGVFWMGTTLEGGFSKTALRNLDVYDATAVLASSSSVAPLPNDPAVELDGVHVYYAQGTPMQLLGPNGWSGTATIHSYSYATLVQSGPINLPPVVVSSAAGIAMLTATSLVVDSAVPEAARVIEIYDETLSASLRLRPLGFQYRTRRNLVLAGAATAPAVLTIDAGVCLEVGGRLEVGTANGGYGDLIALGTADAPVTFKNVPSANEWQGIVFSMQGANANVSKLDFVAMDGAGDPYWLPPVYNCSDHQTNVGAMISIMGPSANITYLAPSITHSRFTNPQPGADGIRTECNELTYKCARNDYSSSATGNQYVGFAAACDPTAKNGACAEREVSWCSR